MKLSCRSRPCPCLFLVLSLALAEPATAGQDRDTVSVVKAAARFVAEQAKTTKDGTFFPEYAEAPEETEASVYAGGAGVLIFLENAGAVLNDKKLLALADETARGLLSSARETSGGFPTWAENARAAGAAGLYTGDAGVGHAFLVRARLRGAKQDLRVAARVADGLIERLRKEGDGACWSDSLDIIAGASGTLLFLVELCEETGQARFKKAALEAGRWLASQGQAVAGPAGEDLLFWAPDRASERHYPNFSHGTSGTAYALTRLADLTGDRKCLEAAVAGARWLVLNGVYKDGTLCWCHYLPGHEDSFMEGWCHGPSGTGRLFLLLAAITGQKSFLEAAELSAAWIMKNRPDPGDRNGKTRFYSPSLCCGAAGVLDYFVDMYRATGAKRYREYAEGVGAYLVRLAKEDGKNLKWTNYDRADETGVIYHGVSLLLGTSGEALALLRLAAIGRQEDPVRHLPDRRVTATRSMKVDEVRLADERKQVDSVPAGALRATVRTPDDAHEGAGYVVLTSRSKPGDPFVTAARELADWRKGELVTGFDPADPERVIPVLRKAGARFVALVLPAAEIDTNTQRRFLMAAAKLDSDIFLDVAYGFITGTGKTAPLDLVRRAKTLEQQGIEKRWVGTGVASGIQSTVYESVGDPTAAVAGYEGKTIYWATIESDPDVMAFVRQQLPEIEGGGVVDFGGCGDPEGIWLFSDQRNMQSEKHWPFDPAKVGTDPNGEMPRLTADLVALMHLENTVVFTGVCHIGSLDRVFVEGDIVSTFGVTKGHTEYHIPPGRSVAAAMLDAGVTAYICPLGPNHGYRVLQEAQDALERRLCLGDVLRSTYNDIALAQGRQPVLDLHLPGNDRVDSAPGAVMYGGGANRTLYGDPALRPFKDDIEPAVAVTRTSLPGRRGGFRLEAKVTRRDWWQWHMFSTDRNGHRIRIVAELQKTDPGTIEVAAAAKGPGGEEIDVGRLDAHIECVDGKRLLHLQVSAPRDVDLGEIGSSATFVLTAAQ